jgi:hypothetical protein
MYETFRSLVKDTTINDVTLLSTDYLNHFNEAVMLLDMIPDMPEMLDEVKDWRPKNYQEHFNDSQFKARAVAIEAFAWSPRQYRAPFDAVVETLNETIAAAVPAIDAVISDSGRLSLVVQEVTMALRGAIDRAGAIINGAMARVDQDGVDAILDIDQEAVDAIFHGPGYAAPTVPEIPEDGGEPIAAWVRPAPGVALAFSRGVARARRGAVSSFTNR